MTPERKETEERAEPAGEPTPGDRIVVFGATGYTGRLVAAALVRRGAKPILAGRDSDRLDAVVGDLGVPLETVLADVRRPDTVRSLVGAGDVLVTTVGPFARWGAAAAGAAVTARAHYIDSTGEPAFVRAIFEEWGPLAERAGCGLLTAFGYDWVPGNLAAALALQRAGDRATRVAIGYFLRGAASGMSGGTMASATGSLFEPGFSFRAGRIVAERNAMRSATFTIDGRARKGASVGSSEHFALPRLVPGLRDVDVYLGWFGPATRALQAVSAGAAVAAKVPGSKAVLRNVLKRTVRGSTGGPEPEDRAASRSHIIAVAMDSSGEPLERVDLEGENPYDFTAEMMAWGATRILDAGIPNSGALGPVEAFGLETLQRGAAEAGLEEVRQLP